MSRVARVFTDLEEEPPHSSVAVAQGDLHAWIKHWKGARGLTQGHHHQSNSLHCRRTASMDLGTTFQLGFSDSFEPPDSAGYNETFSIDTIQRNAQHTLTSADPPQLDIQRQVPSVIGLIP